MRHDNFDNAMYIEIWLDGGVTWRSAVGASLNKKEVARRMQKYDEGVR